MRVVGAILVFVGIALTIGWSRVVEFAYAPLPDGNYGEIFGPVSGLRVPVYVLTSLLILVGAGMVAWQRRKQARATTQGKPLR